VLTNIIFFVTNLLYKLQIIKPPRQVIFENIQYLCKKKTKKKLQYNGKLVKCNRNGNHAVGHTGFRTQLRPLSSQADALPTEIAGH
jgi:hypothetical protein